MAYNCFLLVVPIQDGREMSSSSLQVSVEYVIFGY